MTIISPQQYAPTSPLILHAIPTNFEAKHRELLICQRDISDDENNGATGNTSIAAALQILAAVVAALRPPISPAKVKNDFATKSPFNLDTHFRASAYTTVSSPLNERWNGEVNTFPSFLVALRVCSKQGKWDVTGDQGFFTIDDKNLLSGYHSITDVQIEAARIAHKNP